MHVAKQVNNTQSKEVINEVIKEFRHSVYTSFQAGTLRVGTAENHENLEVVSFVIFTIVSQYF